MEGMMRSGEFASGYVWCPRTIGAYGRMMCSNVDVGARSFVECQPAALAPGPGYYASLCRLEMASKVIIQRRRAGGPSRLKLVSAPYLITDKISPNFIPPWVNFRETR